MPETVSYATASPPAEASQMVKDECLANVNGCACKSCQGFWSDADLAHARWMGVMFSWDEKTGSLICPDCYDTMKASFVGSPDSFKRWKHETLAHP